MSQIIEIVENGPPPAAPFVRIIVRDGNNELRVLWSTTKPFTEVLVSVCERWCVDALSARFRHNGYRLYALETPAMVSIDVSYTGIILLHNVTIHTNSYSGAWRTTIPLMYTERWWGGIFALYSK